MKKLNNTFAAVAVALGIGLAPYANAITLESNGSGDALLFPAFNGYVENYFTISNHSNSFVQGHLRFRGAAWSGELRDFDVILTPGDVLVFRVADVDGDGYWEVDQSLDARTSAEKARGDKPKTFENTGMVHSCTGTAGAVDLCLDDSDLLIPKADSTITQALIEHQRHVGYVEFIGEAVLDGMTHAIMQALVDNPGVWAPYVTSNGNQHGTSAWKWSDAANGFRACTGNNHPCNQGLLDVGNVLSGTAFVTVPGQTHGLAYNAEAFNDFRTDSFGHRIDNYIEDGYGNAIVVGEPTAVILHHDSADSQVFGPSPLGDYVYGCIGSNESYEDELMISFNNTWGPTLADGDDTSGDNLLDAWDNIRLPYVDAPIINMAEINSISEVEAAIAAAGQVYYSYYFNNMGFDMSKSGGKATLNSNYFGFFPTKYYYAENRVAILNPSIVRDCDGLLTYAVTQLVRMAKPITVEVWDTNENNCTTSSANISPARPTTVAKVLGQELNFWDIDWLKAGFNNSACAGFKSGRVVVALRSQAANDAYPGLLYTFESGSDASVSHWRAMQR